MDNRLSRLMLNKIHDFGVDIRRNNTSCSHAPLYSPAVVSRLLRKSWLCCAEL